MAEIAASPEALQAEAALFGRYLIGVAPSQEAVARYVEACAAVFPGVPDPGDTVLLAFVRRRPWAIGPLDAACGMVAPESVLRGRLLLMLALLETTPAHADFFLTPSRSRLALILRLARCGVIALLKAAAGLPILLALRLASPTETASP